MTKLGYVFLSEKKLLDLANSWEARGRLLPPQCNVTNDRNMSWQGSMIKLVE